MTITGSTPGNPTTGVGFKSNDAGSKVYANGGLISLTANSVILTGTVDATSSGNVLIQTLGSGVNLGDGTDTSANLGLSQTELNQITANLLTIGSTTTGNIAVSAAISRPVNGSLALITTNATNNIAVGFPLSTTGTGGISLTGNSLVVTSSITTAGGLITLTANSLSLIGTVNATSSGNVLIQTLGSGVNLGDGTDTSANLGLSQTELNQITANLLTIGSTTTGNIAVSAAISRPVNGSLSLITSNSANITVGFPLSTTGTGGISLTGRNIVVTGNITTAAGDISLTGNNGSYQTGTFDGVRISGAAVNVNTTSGNIMIDGRGALTTVYHGVNLTSSKVQAGGSGCVTITGMSGNGSTNYAYGILASGVTVTTSSGSITVNGSTCGTGSNSCGVYLKASSNISATGAGNVTITGIAANGTDNAIGIHVSSSKVTTSSGSLTVNGTSCGTGTNSRGVYLTSSANISATGAGNVTITGTAENGTNNACGIYVKTSSNVSTSSGSLTVNGTSCGTGTNSFGVFLGSSANISATGMGNVTITGTAENGTNSVYGISVNLSKVTTNSGSLTVNGTSCGTGVSSKGVYLSLSANISATGVGNVTITGSTPGNLTTGIGIDSSDLGSKVYANGGLIALTASSVNLAGTVNATTSGNVLIQTLGSGVILGGADDSANLGLTSAELNQITAATIQIGSTSTGNVTVSSNVTIPAGSNLTLVSNRASTGILSYGTLTLDAGKALNISALPSVITVINGTTAQTQYSQLNVVGDLSIAGKSLNLSGSYTPVAGDVFVVTSATSLTGTFTGLAEASTISLNGMNLTVNYTATSVTLTASSSTSAPSITTQPTNTGVEAGQTATFTAAATGNPAPTVQWQSSPDGSTGWADIGGATSPTLSFTASVGDNGKYYRAVFTNGVSPDATTNSARLAVGVAPIITTVNEMTIPVGMTSGMTVIATGSPAPTYSIATGALPAGITLDSTTGLFMGTPAAGTAGSWPVTIKAENGIGAGATQAFSLNVTSTITSFTVSKGVAQRSYVRYLDLGMDSNASALALLNNPSRVKLTKADLNGVGSTNAPLAGFLSVPSGQSTLAFNFGTIGLGNSRNTASADGYYTLGVDLDGNGSFETNLFFFRLFGDTNGDREVTANDQSAVLAGCTATYNANLDLNGDGVVNSSDLNYVKKSVGRKLKSTLIVTS